MPSATSSRTGTRPPRHPATCRYPERTPPQHSSTPARSASTRRSNREDDPGQQDATGDAADVFKLILERRMARKLNTVIDATNVEQPVRVELVMAAKRHGMPTVAVVVATSLPLCLERQGPRPANRRVPEDVVRSQHQAMVHSHQRLAAEGFNTVVFADALYRMEPFLKRLSQVREADLGRDGSDGLGDLWLARRFFGPEDPAVVAVAAGLGPGDRPGPRRGVPG
ncbi:ATP-binding protein [Streptomyces acidicola]|uniref:ATP-binding protein n=1 Tax=Streptomyces acidicola TaxID=2596892 RepID=UPI0034462068